MILLMYFGAWTLMALGMVMTVAYWSIRSGQWDDMEGAKHVMFRTLAGEMPAEAGDPRYRLVTGLALGVALLSCAALLGGTIFIL